MRWQSIPSQAPYIRADLVHTELAALRAANAEMREALEYILGSQSYEGDLLGHDMARAALNR